MSIERHSRTRKIELGRSLLGQRKIYLDACFWIALRDTASGARTGADDRELLDHLRRGVRSGRLVCPVSIDMLMELVKQRNTPDRRQATAALMDELSLGVAAIDSRTLLGTEICRFLKHANGEGPLHPMQELIWTKAVYAAGEVHPTFEDLDDGSQLEIQKRWHDQLWSMRLSDFIGRLDRDEREALDYERLTAETNSKNLRHRDELSSFDDAYDVELRGAIEMAGETAADIIAEMASDAAGRPSTPTSDERASSLAMCRNLLYQAMKRPENRAPLRTLHVTASIHASMRWDKNRKFKLNDWHDFGHATIALTYCDAFLTERPLHQLVSNPKLDLGSVNGCAVASDMKEAVDVVCGMLEAGADQERR